MAFLCLECEHTVEGNSLPVKCPKCGQSRLDRWVRTPSKIDPIAHEKERRILENLQGD